VRAVVVTYVFCFRFGVVFRIWHAPRNDTIIIAAHVDDTNIETRKKRSSTSYTVLTGFLARNNIHTPFVSINHDDATCPNSEELS